MHHGHIHCDGLDFAVLSSTDGEHDQQSPASVNVQLWTRNLNTSYWLSPSEARDLAARIVLAAVAAENTEPELKVAA
jgi:hypothetical protein